MVWSQQVSLAIYWRKKYSRLEPPLAVAIFYSYALLDVGHGLLADHIKSELHKVNVINRMIFSTSYWYYSAGFIM